MSDTVPITSVRVGGDNLRERMGNLDELKQSIESSGIIEPLIVTLSDDGSYDLISGHRRLAAAERAGLEEVPVRVIEADEAGRDEIMLIENLQRADLSPLEEARGYARLVERDYSLKQLAERLGRTQKHVRGRLQLLELPADLRALVDKGEVALTNALEAREALGPESPLDEEERERVVDMLRSGREVSWMVEQLMTRHRQREIIDEIGARCDEQGIAWCVRKGMEMPDNVVPIDGERDSLDIDPEDEDVKPYVGVMIDLSQRGEPKARKALMGYREWRKKARKRAKDDPDAVPEAVRLEDERKEREREARRVEREERQRHAAHIGRIAKARPKQSLVRPLLVHAVLAQVNPNNAREVAESLGIEPEVYERPTYSMDGEEKTRRERDWYKPLREFIEQGPANAERVAIAHAMIDSDFGHRDLSNAKKALLEAYPEEDQE